MDWDQVRFFLAVAQAGSVRAASDRLGVNHSTILRQIARLEQQLGTVLFDKTPSGYRCTEGGHEILPLALQMEAASNQLQARVSGRDQELRGKLKVTMPAVVASHLLMPDLLDFGSRHPEVELEVSSENDPVNLTNREADVAVRAVADRNALPANLHGIKGPDIAISVYIASPRLATWTADAPLRWIVKDRYGHPDWATAGHAVGLGAVFTTTDTSAQLAAVRHGFGATLLPCFVGDAEAGLSRLPGSPVRKMGTLWLLSYGEIRKAHRVRKLLDFLSDRIAAHAGRLSGLAMSRTIDL